MKFFDAAVAGAAGPANAAVWWSSDRWGTWSSDHAHEIMLWLNRYGPVGPSFTVTG